MSDTSKKLLASAAVAVAGEGCLQEQCSNCRDDVRLAEEQDGTFQKLLGPAALLLNWQLQVQVGVVCRNVNGQLQSDRMIQSNNA
jgi:hypothetical protein